MTKIQLQYDLVRPLTDSDSKGISDVHGYYGFLRVQPAASADKGLDKVNVEYDASRLSEKDVESVLLQYGVPIRRKWAV
jgi:hypothetical protein